MELYFLRSKYFLKIPITIIIVFLVPAIISFTNINYLKMIVNDKVATTNVILKLMSYENASLRLEIQKNKENFVTYSTNLLEEMTNIKIDDLRSFIRNEFPGNDFKSIPSSEVSYYSIESSPPLEELLIERKKSLNGLEKNKNIDNNVAVNGNLSGKKVLIYHSHSWEDFLPKGEGTGKTTITTLGDLLGKVLAEKGIDSIVDKTNISQELEKKGWETNKSYHLSRDIVQTVMAANNDLEYFIDLHRDSFGKEMTSITLNNQPFAKIAFVIGEDNPNFKRNYEFANALHQFLEGNYPGLSRGILRKYGAGVDGVYNQDLSPNSLVIEVGGVENNIEELKNSINALGEAISQHYWQALEVNGSY